MSMNGPNKNRFVSFRLDEAQWLRLEDVALAAGDNPNDWCRKLIQAETGSNHTLTRNEMFLFEELSRVRFLIGTGLTLLAAGELKPEIWERAKAEAEAQAEGIARLLIEKYGGHWFLSNREGGDEDGR